MYANIYLLAIITKDRFDIQLETFELSVPTYMYCPEGGFLLGFL